MTPLSSFPGSDAGPLPMEIFFKKNISLAGVLVGKAHWGVRPSALRGHSNPSSLALASEEVLLSPQGFSPSSPSP